MTALIKTDLKYSFEVLCDVQIKNDNRMNDIRFQDISRKLQKFWIKEALFFEQWGTELLILEDQTALERLTSLVQQLRNSTASSIF